MTAQTATVPDGDLLTIGELATRLKLNPGTVRRLKRDGTIPALVLGHRTLRFSWPDVLASLRQAQDGHIGLERKLPATK